ncbi:MAG TPA: PaaI family thioesterase [Terriglobales bacterium]|nr:PaaI family thioesterase [Terriglobales bacterium]
MPTFYEGVQKMIRGEAPGAPVARLVGFRVVAAQPGEATVELAAGPQHANPMGTLHGGVLCDIADAAMGIAYACTLGEDESFTTLELKINFLRPIWKGTLRAVGRVVKKGGTVGLVECDVLDEQERLAARASSTCMTLRGDQARGR